MLRHRSSRGRVAALLGLLAIAVAGCSSSDDDAGPDPAEEADVVTFTGTPPDEITPPPVEGNGMVVPQPAAPAPDGYVTDELFVGGGAQLYREALARLGRGV